MLDEPRLRARLAVTIVFSIHGATLATWVSRIPQIKAHLGLDEAQLGLALLGAPIGAVIAVRGAGWVVGRWGSRTGVRAAALGACASLVLPALVWNMVSLLAALVLLGTSLGLLDVAMNAQGVAVERAYRRPLMSGLHGAYSIGALVGAAMGSLVAKLGVPPLWHFAIAAAVLAIAGFAVFSWLLGPAADLPPESDAAGAAAPTTMLARLRDSLGGFRAVLVLAIIGLCSFVGEGAVADWSGVYLRETLLADIGITGLGFAGMSVAMAFGRLIGDRLVERLGPVLVVRAGSVLATAGMAIALSIPHPWVAIAGFTLFGLGVAPMAPVTFSAAGNLPGVRASSAISRVTSIGYLGFLGAPPAIGFLAQAFGLRWALALAAVLVALILPLSRSVRRPSG
jgi:MFS family permease